MTIDRFSSPMPGLVIGTTPAASTAINLQHLAGGTLECPTGSALTLLTWYSSIDGKTWRALQDGAGTAITTQVGSAVAVAIPVTCFGCAYITATDPVGGAVDVNLKG